VKRRIDVKGGGVTVTAKIDTGDMNWLTRHEVERIRDQLADRLQEAVANVLYVGVPRNRVQVT